MGTSTRTGSGRRCGYFNAAVEQVGPQINFSSRVSISLHLNKSDPYHAHIQAEHLVLHHLSVSSLQNMSPIINCRTDTVGVIGPHGRFIIQRRRVHDIELDVIVVNSILLESAHQNGQSVGYPKVCCSPLLTTFDSSRVEIVISGLIQATSPGIQFTTSRFLKYRHLYFLAVLQQRHHRHYPYTWQTIITLTAITCAAASAASVRQNTVSPPRLRPLEKVRPLPSRQRRERSRCSSTLTLLLHASTMTCVTGTGSGTAAQAHTPSFDVDLEDPPVGRPSGQSTRQGSTTSIKQLTEPFVAVEPVFNNVLHHIASPDDLQDALLSLPPPPSYDVTIENLSIAVPPYRAYIPTPIPIPIPRFITDTARKWGTKTSQDISTRDRPTQDAGDGLIVRSVNAVVKRGEVMAIIGGSGSGKTTLLHAIAARLGDLPIAEGHVSITPSSGGSEKGQDAAAPKGGEGHFKGMSKVLGFVRQNDYLLPHLTGTSAHIFVHTPN